ncbi:MAG: SpoIIE family protein phosphatase [Desulfobacteraceae bacterium]|nr:SpoIIE family protein phosphatase [Desulfobacteraceae bacterium]
MFAGPHEDILIRCADTGKVEEIETKGIILFTDGITEAADKNGDMFGNERLVRIIEKSIHNSDSAIHENIIDALKPYDKPDDVTLVVVKRFE